MGAAGGRPLICGEVRTALVQALDPLPSASAERLLRLRPDEPVRVSERPNLYARSPELLTGVDCLLPSANGAKVRCAGTLQARACVTEGRVLQATAYFRVLPARAADRQQWSHYLARPGAVEAIGRLRPDDAADGFLAARPATAGTLDAGAVAERLLTRIAADPVLDGNRGQPFKSRRTRLRWTVAAGEAAAPAVDRFTLAADGVRTLALRLPGAPHAAPCAVAVLCEDIALHDWLLTTLVTLVERSRLGSAAGPEAVLSLRPAIDQLLHLWMPKARVEKDLSPLWDVLEREPGFSRQWQTLVQRIRDQLALHTISLLRTAPALS